MSIFGVTTELLGIKELATRQSHFFAEDAHLDEWSPIHERLGYNSRTCFTCGGRLAPGGMSPAISGMATFEEFAEFSANDPTGIAGSSAFLPAVRALGSNLPALGGCAAKTRLLGWNRRMI